MPVKPLPAEDLAHILAHSRAPFDTLRNARIFITGGTGFFGHWLLESLSYANHQLELNLKATVLTRSAPAFALKSPHITRDPAITLLEGDIKTFAFPSTPHTHILHAATDTTANASNLSAAILDGTRHVLAFAQATGAHRLLYTSSGAVYGRNITTPTRIPETHPTTPDPTHPYDTAKLQAEHLCLSAPLETTIARCFASVGPHLPLDQHFAIGNFIRDALRPSSEPATPIHIKGDGTPLRSFLYMSDLAIWLWNMLALAPARGIYNVGSDESLSIAALAHLVAATLNPTLPIHIDGTPTPNTPPPTYVPDITLATTELGLTPTIPLPEAIRRTATWHTT